MTTTSATGSATQSLISSLGAGSGIDMAALAANLAAAQFAPKSDRLAAKSETLEARITAAANLKGLLLGLSTSLGARVREGDLSPQPQLANGAVARASLSGTRQPGGTYSLEVTQLAKSQTLASPAYAAATSTTGSGTLTLRFGTVSGGAFTEDTAHAAVPIAVASGATLNDVAAAINSARSGVSAYVANTTEGAKLVLKGMEGAANGFVLEAAETVGEEGLASLAWTPAAAPERLPTTAGDAAFKIDGLEITSKTNTVTDAVPGVTLQLTEANTGAPTSLTFSDPVGAITGAMQDLTAALNEVAAGINAATDPKSGDLARDDGARALKRSFSALAGTAIMPNAPAIGARTLADLGLSTQRDGTFQLDTARLAATLKSDPQGAAAMFTNGLFGVYATIDGIARKAASITDPSSLAGSIRRYSEQQVKAAGDMAKLTEDQEELRARLVTRFAVADSRIGASQSTLTFLNNQIDAWNAPRN